MHVAATDCWYQSCGRLTKKRQLAMMRMYRTHRLQLSSPSCGGGAFFFPVATVVSATSPSWVQPSSTPADWYTSRLLASSSSFADHLRKEVCKKRTCFHESSNLPRPNLLFNTKWEAINEFSGRITYIRVHQSIPCLCTAYYGMLWHWNLH